ncbi:MAG: arylsulfatase A-like enzyme [Planctomycetota bacterium]|jgi:arylsulfatase A-like enzyme
MRPKRYLLLITFLALAVAGVPALRRPWKAIVGSPLGLAIQGLETSNYPNVLLIIDDQHSARVLGVAGNPIVQTPRLDQLAAEGAWFSAGYCNDPICGPSRYSMLTGRYPSEIGTLCNGDSPVTGVKYLAEYLTEFGYFTGSSGKNHFGSKAETGGFEELHPHPFYNLRGESEYTPWFESQFTEREIEGSPYFWTGRKGWMSRLDPEDGRCTINPHPADLSPEHWTTEVALGLIDHAIELEKPFFVQASYLAPHHPYGPLQEYYDLYEDSEMKLPESWYSTPHSNRLGMSEDEWKSVMHHYYSYVSQVDHYIGELLDGLEERGLADDTLVIMVSDHGDMMGEFGLMGKGDEREGSLAVPFIVRWPAGFDGGKVVDSPVSLIDVLPTIFDALGEKQPELARGHSVLPLIAGDEGASARRVFALDVRREPYLLLVARDWRWKLSLHTRNSRTPAMEFYDILNDPWELEDLSGEPTVAPARERLLAELGVFWSEQSAALVREPQPNSASAGTHNE